MPDWTFDQVKFRSDGRSGHNEHFTVAQVAQGYVATLIEDFNAGRVNDTYSEFVTKRRVQAFTIAGGGPGAEVVFIFDDDDELDLAYVDYFEGGKDRAIIPMFDGFAEKLYEALRTPAG